MNNLISLSKLFDNKIFRIPDYQRGYAWQMPQLSYFWDDLISLAENQYHYTGMLSLKKLKREEYSAWDEEKWLIEQNYYEPYHIVDGQQRLTTFIILVNTIIKKAEKEHIDYLNNTSICDIKSKYIVEYKNPEYILKAYKFGYETDNPSFLYLRYKILGEDAPGDIKETFYTLNLEVAKKFFEESVDELYSKGKDKALETLFSKLVNRLQFNILDIEDDFDVFVAFETMNNRGKKLSNLEILKNRLIYLTTVFPDSTLSQEEKRQLRKDINDTWSEVYFQLGRNKNKPLNDDDYLKNHWIIYFTYSRKKGNDYINFLLNRFFTSKAIFGINTGFSYDKDFSDSDESNFEPDDASSADCTEDPYDSVLYPIEIVNYIKNLKSVAKYWYYSFNPSESPFFESEEKKWIDKLNRIGINYFRPLIVVSYLNDDVTSSQRIELFKTIEKFIFMCFRMARFQASYYSSQVYAFAHKLLTKEITVDVIIRDILNKFYNNMYEATNTFISRTVSLFKNGNGFYDWWDLPYFLFEYELSLSEKTNVGKLTDWSNFKNDKDTISIEHIFPQTPTCWYWKNQFRDYSAEEKKVLSNSLGNLLALAQKVNSSLQNDEFEKKKNGTDKRTRGYYNGSYSEMEVARYKDWTPQTILERGMHLLDFMEKRWDFIISENEEEKYNKKLELLGISFVKDGRQISEEIPKELPLDVNAQFTVKDD